MVYFHAACTKGLGCLFSCEQSLNKACTPILTPLPCESARSSAQPLSISAATSGVASHSVPLLEVRQELEWQLLTILNSSQRRPLHWVCWFWGNDSNLWDPDKKLGLPGRAHASSARSWSLKGQSFHIYSMDSLLSVQASWTEVICRSFSVKKKC